jgi:hypothetical protein
MDAEIEAIINKHLKEKEAQTGVKKPQRSFVNLPKDISAIADKYAPKEAPGIFSMGGLANIAEGAAIGGGDILYGAGAAAIENLKESLRGENKGDRLVKGMGGSVLVVKEDGTTRPASAEEIERNRSSFGEKASKHRKIFNDVKRQYNEAHPIAGAIEEGIGSIAPMIATGGLGAGAVGAKAAGQAALKQTAKAAAKSGSKWGAAYGAGHGFTEGDSLTDPDAIKNALYGALGGAFFGGISGGAASLIGKGINAAAKPLTKGGRINRFAGKIGRENIDKSIESRTPLLNTADEKVMEIAEGSRLNNTQARQIYREFAKGEKSKQVGNIDDEINKTFGKRGAEEVLEEIKAAGQQKYEPLYKEAMKAGKINPYKGGYNSEGVFEMHSVLKNPRIEGAIKRVRKDFPELHNLPDNDIRILDLAKQHLDSEIGKAVKFEDNYQASFLSQARADLLSVMDKRVPVYAKARQSFADMKELENYVNLGRNIHRMNREQIENLSKTLSPNNKKAFYSGIREKLIKDLDDGAKSEGVNAARRVFDDSVLRKLEGLGIDDFASLKQRALSQRQSIENINRLTGGSQTAERLADREALNPVRMLFNPKRTLKAAAEKAFKKLTGLHDDEIARYLTDPKALEAAMKSANLAERAKAGAFYQWQRGAGAGAAANTEKIRQMRQKIRKIFGEGAQRAADRYLNEELKKGRERL